MNTKSTTHKAEELGEEGSSETLKSFRTGNETLKSDSQKIVPAFTSEAEFLEWLRENLRTARELASPEISPIARDWERVINYRIRITLQERERRAAARAKRQAMRTQAGVTARLG